MADVFRISEFTIDPERCPVCGRAIQGIRRERGLPDWSADDLVRMAPPPQVSAVPCGHELLRFEMKLRSS